METAFIESPLGITKIIGDENGISEISVLSEGVIGTEIPPQLHDCVSQLHEYFNGKRNHFNFKLNPQGTDFQQRVWQEFTLDCVSMSSRYRNRWFANRVCRRFVA